MRKTLQKQFYYRSFTVNYSTEAQFSFFFFRIIALSIFLFLVMQKLTNIFFIIKSLMRILRGSIVICSLLLFIVPDITIFRSGVGFLLL